MRYGFFALLLVVPVVAHAQSNSDFVIGEAIQLESRVFGEPRSITVHKPPGYDQTEYRYPVLYLLDGRANFHHVTGLTTFLASAQRIPGLLVVGVENANRDRELTTPRSDPEYQYPNGGADQFLQFMNDELVPWIDREYRTVPYRILHGHSLAGLFVIHALLSEQQPFGAFIAISPSLQYDDQVAIRRADEVLTDRKELNATLYMAVGNDGDTLLSGMRRLAALLDEDAPEHLLWTFERMENESHASVVNRATYRGLEFVFSDWHLPDLLSAYDRFGLEGIERFYDKSGDKLGIDRQMPRLTIDLELVLPLVERNRWNEAVAVAFRDPAAFPPSQGIAEILADEYSSASGDPEAMAEFVRLVRDTFERDQADVILGYLEP